MQHRLLLRSAQPSDAPAVATAKRRAALDAYAPFVPEPDLANWLAKRADETFIA